MSLSSRTLFRGELVRIGEVHCRPDACEPGAEEQSPVDTLVLPGRGRFLQHLAGGAQVLAEPTQALLFAADRPYRVSHPDPHGDECLSFEFAPGAQADVLPPAAGVDRLGDDRLRPHAHLSPAAAAARALLWRRLVRKTAAPLEIEETALALLASAAAGARREDGRARRRGRRPVHTERALAVRELLWQRPADSWRLGDLARRVYTTPFHLARCFRDEVGMPVHQYHLRVRLAGALDLLLDTRQSLAQVALACGFASHSHFTAVFSRLTGVAPARLRGAARGEAVRQVRAALLGADSRAG